MIKNCAYCNREFNIIHERDGIVLNDHVFVCAPCIQSNSRQEIFNWMCTQLGMSNNYKSINIWLNEQQNHNHND